MRLFAALERHGGSERDAARYRSVAKTHIGLVRKINEDRLIERPDAGLWAVVDGMGGHQGGDIAATIAIRALDDCANEPAPLTIERITAALIDAHGQMRRRLSTGEISGCTVAGLFIEGDAFTVFWAGDSRAYRYRDRTLEQLTRDHSLIQELIDARVVTREQAIGHAQAHVITRALGAAESVELDCVTGAVARGDRFLLCSDGLWGMMPERAIAAHMALPLTEMASALTADALAGGGLDNLALIAIERA